MEQHTAVVEGQAAILHFLDEGFCLRLMRTFWCDVDRPHRRTFVYLPIHETILDLLVKAEEDHLWSRDCGIVLFNHLVFILVEGVVPNE